VSAAAWTALSREHQRIAKVGASRAFQDVVINELPDLSVIKRHVEIPEDQRCHPFMGVRKPEVRGNHLVAEVSLPLIARYEDLTKLGEALRRDKTTLRTQAGLALLRVEKGELVLKVALTKRNLHSAIEWALP
jgi:hypothetical protein